MPVLRDSSSESESSFANIAWDFMGSVNVFCLFRSPELNIARSLLVAVCNCLFGLPFFRIELLLLFGLETDYDPAVVMLTAFAVVERRFILLMVGDAPEARELRSECMSFFEG